MLLMKISTSPEVRHKKVSTKKLLKNESFILLLDDLKGNFNKDLSPKNKIDILHTLLRMNLYDQELLEMYVNDVREKKFKQANQLTNLLYIMAKMRF